ncbi:hypothetical protein O9992_24660 [Vibrio lentus]|nr:hypothetical protein [Vibrio lentus]
MQIILEGSEVMAWARHWRTQQRTTL